MVKSKNIPLAVDVGEVIRVDDALLCFAAAGFAVRHFNLAALSSGLGEGIKDFQVQDWFSAGAERDGLFDLSKIQGDRVRQRLLHFSDGTEKRLFKAGATILLQSFFRDNERENFAFG